ncbi:MAG: hypothetical protein NT069_35700 [Planctomycetota bacterium]|nr:hypothetical protein [Planctomycetota bacterium]
MLSNFSRHTRRTIAFCLTFALCSTALTRPLAAQSEVVRAHEEAVADDPSATVFGKVVQAGAKILGKGTKPSTEKEILDAEPKGNSTTAARKQAIAALPLDHLTAEQRDRVAGITKNVSFYRRLPKVSFPVEPEVYKYFLSHPDVAVSVWRAMQISKLQMFQTGKHEYEADAGDGSVGAIEIVHSGPDKHLAICEGSFTNPILKTPVEAHSLLLLQTSFITEADGTIMLTHRADLFISFPSQTIDVAAKVFSPLTVSLTDRTFTEVSMFVRMMSIAMSRRPDWVEQLTEKMDGIPEIRKKQLMELTISTHSRAIQRAVEQAEFEQGEDAALDEPGIQRVSKPVEPSRSDSVPPRRLPNRGPASSRGEVR